MRQRLGAQTVEAVCFLESPDQSSASLVVRVGDYTSNVSVQVFVSGTLSVIFIQRVFAPTAQYNAEVVNTFFPLSGQMNLGGGSDPACSDGVDNDEDGQTDFPNDSGCASASDPSEGG